MSDETHKPDDSENLDRIYTNLVMSALSYGMGAYAFTRENKHQKIGWGCGSFLFWFLQFEESLSTKTYNYLSNVVDAEDAKSKLEKMTKAAPLIDVKIINFHHESVHDQYYYTDPGT